MKIGVQAIFKAVKDRTDGAGCTSVHQESKEQFFFPQIEGQQDFFSTLKECTVSISAVVSLYSGASRRKSLYMRPQNTSRSVI